MFERYSIETWVCSIRGHVTPAATATEIGPEHAGVGLDLHPGVRLARCLRCDAWVAGARPTEGGRLGAIEGFELPRRGKALRQAVILRIIAIERGIHSVIFALISILGLVVRSKLAGIQGGVRKFLENLASQEAQTGRATNHSLLTREGTRVLHLNTGTLEVLIFTAAAYALVEGIEAVGLWRERRWAEYLTAVATAGLLPLEVHELLKRVTAIRAGALVVNIAVLGYLVYAKRLFGIHGGGNETKGEAVDRSIFSHPL